MTAIESGYSMRKWMLLVLMMAASITTPGCAWMTFGLFENYYSAGDSTPEGKAQHFRDQQEKWANWRSQQ